MTEKVQKKYMISWKEEGTEQMKSIVALVLDETVFEEENIVEMIRQNLASEHGLNNVTIEEQQVTDEDQQAHEQLVKEQNENNKGVE